MRWDLDLPAGSRALSVDPLRAIDRVLLPGHLLVDAAAVALLESEALAVGVGALPLFDSTAPVIGRGLEGAGYTETTPAQQAIGAACRDADRCAAWLLAQAQEPSEFATVPFADVPGAGEFLSRLEGTPVVDEAAGVLVAVTVIGSVGVLAGAWFASRVASETVSVLGETWQHMQRMRTLRSIAQQEIAAAGGVSDATLAAINHEAREVQTEWARPWMVAAAGVGASVLTLGLGLAVGLPRLRVA